VNCHRKWPIAFEGEKTPLSKDIDDLQSGLRTDFDQKLNELSNLLIRFRALIVSPPKGAKVANDEEVLDPTDESPLSHSMSDTTADLVTDVEFDKEKHESIINTEQIESARFEFGLYKLNSQLYRFRLELDQELEYREEPLHVHFRAESELSKILQQINDRTSEKHPDNQ